MKWLLVLWINDRPILEGAKYFETKQELYNYHEEWSKKHNLKGIKYTMVRIYNKETNKYY